MFVDFLDREFVIFIGDGCCDLLGYSVKYGMYIMMDIEIKNIVDFDVVYVK